MIILGGKHTMVACSTAANMTTSNTLKVNQYTNYPIVPMGQTEASTVGVSEPPSSGSDRVSVMYKSSPRSGPAPGKDQG